MSGNNQSQPQATMGQETTTPANAISSFGFLRDIINALSADDVQPLAVYQMQALGTYFHSNGPFYDETLDLLTRRKSMRLERLSLSVRWAKGDTAAYMAETTAGRTVATLC